MAAKKHSLGNGYYTDGTVDPKTGAFTVYDASGNKIAGATPYVAGNTTGVRTPVQALTDLPSGSYDPSLLYDSQNANLGSLYSHQDYGTQWDGATLNPDSTLNLTQPADTSTLGRSLQDYFTQKGALATALERANQDYATNTGTLNRNYQTLANNQLQAINAAGDLEGGALAQALAKRTANQAIDQSALDTNMGRYRADNATQQAGLDTAENRGYSDANTTLSRSDQSGALYQGGLFASGAAQANQSGMLAGNPNYTTHNGVLYQTLPNGTKTPVKKKPATPTTKPVNPWDAWHRRQLSGSAYG